MCLYQHHPGPLHMTLLSGLQLTNTSAEQSKDLGPPVDARSVGQRSGLVVHVHVLLLEVTVMGEATTTESTDLFLFKIQIVP